MKCEYCGKELKRKGKHCGPYCLWGRKKMRVPEPKKRFEAVSDLPEWTVWDNQEKRDLFPTKSGNRQYACKMCHENIALLIADALNAYLANDQDHRRQKPQEGKA